MRVRANASICGAKTLTAIRCSAKARAQPSTMKSPRSSTRPSPAPEPRVSSARPTVASTTPTSTAGAGRLRITTLCSTGTMTTDSPVMSPALKADV